MRILFITPFFYPHKGGTERYAQELLAALIQKHPDVSADVLCYNTEKAVSFEKRFRLNIHRVSCFTIFPDQFILPNPFQLIKALKALSRNHHQVVITQTRFFDSAWWVWLYAKVIGAKSVFIGHGAAFVKHQNPLVTLTARLVDLTLARVSIKFYDQIIVISYATQNFYKKHLGVKNSTIIYGGINIEDFTKQRKKSSRKIPEANQVIPTDSVVISYVGRLLWSKGISFLLEAFRQLAPKRKNLHLVLAGSGSLEKGLRKKIRRYHLSGRVLLTGRLEEKEVSALLSLTDIFVHPSLNEGLPRVVMEAAVSGGLVVATDVGATGEIIQNKKSGLLISPSDTEGIVSAINWALDHSREAEAMRQKARKDVKEKFDWRVVSEEFYKQIISPFSQPQK